LGTEIVKLAAVPPVIVAMGVTIGCQLWKCFYES
jgi:hypothetical protein